MTTVGAGGLKREETDSIAVLAPATRQRLTAVRQLSCRRAAGVSLGQCF